MKLLFTAIAILWVSLRPLHANEGPRKGKPNIIVIMTDDQGYGDLSCHGSLDRQCCSPTRRSLAKTS